MKHFIYSIILFSTVSCITNVDDNQIMVIPQPITVETYPGSLNLESATFWVDDRLCEESLSSIDTFRLSLSASCGKESDYSSSRIKADIRFSYDERIAPEAYEISVNRRRCQVVASSFRGFLYAVETLKQLLPVGIYTGSSVNGDDFSLPCVKVKDAPRFGYRGLHMDSARHFWTVDQVKRYLDIMVIHKMNTFHWHLTDDQGWRLEIKKYPKLVEIGSRRKGTVIGKGWYEHIYDGIPYEGHYTQDDIREIVAYAAERGIDIIPEIDLPGHMLAAIASYPELGCTGRQLEVWGRWGVSSDVLCVGKEATFKFLEDVLLEVIDLFPYKYIHIGGDECPKVRWKECPACKAKMKELGFDGENAAELLQGYVTNRVESFLAEHDRSIIGWDEILSGDISKTATIMSWRGTEGGIAASEAGHDVIMTPNSYCYLDYYQSRKTQNEPFAIGGFVDVRKVYSFEPITSDMTPAQQSHILGVQANLWTEYIKTPEHQEYMLLPRMSALSEVQWCTPENRDYERFLDKMGHMVDIYKILDYNFARHIFEVSAVISVDDKLECPEVKLVTQGNPPMYYTLDGSEPTEQSSRYVEPVCVKDGSVFKAIVVRDDMQTETYTQEFIKHKAMGKPVLMNTEPHPLYSAGLPQSLVNGVLNESEDAAAGEWMAWKGVPVEVVIDMKGETYSRLSVRSLVSKWEDMYAPLGLSAYASDDNENFKLLATEEYPLELEAEPDGVKLYDIEFSPTSSRYLKVVVETVPALPEWSERTGSPAYLFLDEIKVE